MDGGKANSGTERTWIGLNRVKENIYSGGIGLGYEEGVRRPFRRGWLPGGG